MGLWGNRLFLFPVKRCFPGLSLLVRFRTLPESEQAPLLRSILYEFVPYPEVRHGILAVCAGMFALTILWRCFVKRQVTGFADEICDMLDQMIKGDFCRQNQIYEDSLYARIQGKLLRFYDIVRETRKISIQDKKTIDRFRDWFLRTGTECLIRSEK